jgi:hypothetical protein
LLPSVTKVLAIGWRAQDAGFIELLRQFMPAVGGTLVANSNAESIVIRLREEVGGPWVPLNGGFSHLLLTNGHTKFLEEIGPNSR